jgi:hypothetical protein
MTGCRLNGEAGGFEPADELTDVLPDLRLLPRPEDPPPPLPTRSRRARRACPRSHGRSPSARQGGRPRRRAHTPARPRQRGRRPGNTGAKSGRRDRDRARATRKRSPRTQPASHSLPRAGDYPASPLAAPARNVAPAQARQPEAQSKTETAILTRYRQSARRRRAHRTVNRQACARTSDQPRALTVTESHTLLCV